MRDLKKIAKRYVKSQFILDLLCVIPFRYFFSDAHHSLSAVQKFKLLHLFKLLRL